MSSGITSRLFLKSSSVSSPRLLASPFIVSSQISVRGYRLEKRIQIRERGKEQRKTWARKAYEMLDLPSPYKIPPREKIADYNPRYMNRVPMNEDNPHWHDEKTYIFNHLCRLEEGVQQALWLTKSKLMGDGKLPERTQELASRLEMPNMEERVKRSISKCRQYDTTSKLIPVERYSYTQNMDFLHLCTLMSAQYPEILQRVQTEDYYVAAAWHRADEQIQVRGRSGLLVSSTKPLERLASPEEVAETADHVLPDFYPLAPTIDMLTRNVYKDKHNFTGFFEGTPFPHAHTLFIHDSYNWCKNQMNHLNAKALMFAFASAMSRAKLQYGVDAEIELDEPIVTQSIVSTGVKFTFIQLQLNTLNMNPNEGVKNMVWVDEGNVLFDDHYPVLFKIFKGHRGIHTKPSYKKKMHRRDPDLGCRDLDLNVFRKFLALYVNGAA